MRESFHDICAETDLASGESRAELLNGWPILLCRSDGGYAAVINRCTHAESPLAGGRLRRGTISCPLHGARFQLDSGKCIGAPYRALKTFEVRVEDGRVKVAVPHEAPGYEYMPVRTV